MDANQGPGPGPARRACRPPLRPRFGGRTMAPMARDLIVTAVGLDERTIAHLRLLMRQAAARLERRWQWGNEAEADLVLVNPESLAGQVSRTRCESSGVRCALVCAPGHNQAGALVLHVPLRLDNVVDVLRRAVEPTFQAQPVRHQDADFYLDGPPGGTAEPGPADARPPADAGAPVAKGREELMRDDAGLELLPQPKVRVLDAATLGAASTASSRREQRSNDAPDAIARSQPRSLASPATPGAARQPGLEPPPGQPPGTTPGLLAATGVQRLLASYMGGELLGGPAQIRLDGMPSLTLDPKHRVFHSEAPLSHLARYCTENLPRTAWRPVTSGELAQLRVSQPPRLYEYLVWLEALLRSNGRLASNLDPGGSYRLRQMVVVDTHYHAHGPISHAMRTPTKLNEIAARSGAGMEAVFDIVNAYAAIGWLEWSPRDRLKKAAGSDQPAGLWARLKRPFQ